VNEEPVAMKSWLLLLTDSGKVEAPVAGEKHRIWDEVRYAATVTVVPNLHVRPTLLRKLVPSTIT
jgi:hypothetical protein